MSTPAKQTNEEPSHIASADNPGTLAGLEWHLEQRRKRLVDRMRELSRQWYWHALVLDGDAYSTSVATGGLLGTQPADVEREYAAYVQLRDAILYLRGERPTP